ncbi:MAG: transposase [Bryobacteraceae bacterium]
MGEKQNQPFQLSFNASLKVDFQGSRVTSDGGLILVRELDERLGFGELIAQHLSDSGRGKNTQLPPADLFRQSVYSRIAGYEDRCPRSGDGVDVGDGHGEIRATGA